jgi:EpsI family protein
MGTLYAALTYRSAIRRAVFLAASIVVPIVANWLRAYLVVMLAYLTSNKIAVGVDHLIYGWIFFGVVMLLLFWVGSHWKEAPAEPTVVTRASGMARGEAGRPRNQHLVWAALAAIAFAGLWLPAESALKPPTEGNDPALPAVAGEHGWTDAAAQVARWKPHYTGFGAERIQTFEKEGRDVGLYLAYYRGQEKGRELITSANALVTTSEWDWKRLSYSGDTVDWRGARQGVDAATLSGPGARLQVFRLYWINGRTTASDYVAKLLTAWSVLSGRGDDSALIVMYAPQQSSPEEARSVLRGFAAEMSPAIERALTAARGSPG